jgi:hypothetical protein
MKINYYRPGFGGLTRIFLMAKYLRMILRDRERKPLIRIGCEFMISSLMVRSLASYYFTSLLHKRGMGNYRYYLSHAEMADCQEMICDERAVNILHNKLSFHQHYEQTGLRLPRLLAFNYGNKFYVKKKDEDEVYQITSPQLMRDLILEELIPNTCNNSLFIKPIEGCCGNGARKVCFEKERYSMEDFEELLKYVSAKSFLFQEEVMQAPELSRLNASSLNTVRMDTVKLGNGNPEILSGFLRIGLAGSNVDNIAAGGIYVGIELQKGVLKAKGFNKLGKGGNIYFAHPNTKVLFLGFRIPFFEEVKKLAIEAAERMPQALIGWDIGIEREGPILMEGNAIYYDMQLSDVAYGGYRNNPVYKKITGYMDQRRKQIRN